MKYSALIPVKTLALAKSRLAVHLSPQQRETLVLDMLYHVVHTLCESDVFEQVYVVSADSRILELVQHWGVEALRETRAGHNPALSAAALTILERTAWRHGAYSTWTILRQQDRLEKAEISRITQLFANEGLLTISADLPLITQEDIRALIQEAEQHQLVLVSSSDGTGTNALLTRPPLAIPYLFGINSLSAYIRAARAHHITYTLYHNTHLAFDVDTPEDIQKLENLGGAWLCANSVVL